MARRATTPQTDQTILVVDDHEETLISVSNLLRREGHRVLTADSAAGALALFKQYEVDLLLVDYMMPRVSGADLVREIRTLDPFVQIILQTGYAGQQPPRLLISGLDVQGYHEKAEGPDKLLLWVEVGLKVSRLVKDLRRRLAGQAPTITTATILLIGGSESCRAADAVLLSGEGHRVVGAATSSEGLALCLRERPDILLVDRSVVESAGGEILRRIRALDVAVPMMLRARGLDPDQRRHLLQTFELHGIYDPDGDASTLQELTTSALSSIRRVRNSCAVQELRDLIVAKLCHELRNSLHAIRGYAEILRGEPVDPSAADILARLELASDSALGLAQDYLDLARLDAPGVVVRREPLDLNSLLADLHDLSRRQIGTRPVRFVADAAAPQAFLATDGEKLRAILAQLLANAIKFTHSGEIRLHIRAAIDHTDFILADAGPGLDPSTLANLLSSPPKPRSEIAATTPGQGLGLAIALRLSALIGASLTTETDARGAVFTLTLPVAVSRREDAYQPTLH